MQSALRILSTACPVALLVGQFFTQQIFLHMVAWTSVLFVVKNVDTGGVKLAAAIETMLIKAVFRIWDENDFNRHRERGFAAFRSYS